MIVMFLTAGELAEALKRADGFRPVKKSRATPQP
jgi:hypothetical protein